MAHFDADKCQGLHDPIEFTLGGKRYPVVTLTDDLFDRLRDATKDMERPGESLAAQLAVYTGCEAEEFSAHPIPTLRAILDFIGEQMTDPLGKAKNAPK